MPVRLADFRFFYPQVNTARNELGEVAGAGALKGAWYREPLRGNHPFYTSPDKLDIAAWASMIRTVASMRRLMVLSFGSSSICKNRSWHDRCKMARSYG